MFRGEPLQNERDVGERGPDHVTSDYGRRPLGLESPETAVHDSLDKTTRTAV